MLVDQLVNGLVLGAVYALAGVSFALVMGVLGILNIASAALFLLGGYVGLTMLSEGMPLWLSFVAVIAAMGLGGLLVERVGYFPFRHSPFVIPLLSTLGLTIIVESVVINTWGSDPIQIPTQAIVGRIDLGVTSLSATQLLIITASVILLGGLGAMMRWTWIGRSIRAVAESRRVASLLGVPVSRVTLTTFALAGMLAGAAGLLIGLNYQVLAPSSGLELGLKGIAVMVVGGARNVWGGLAAGPVLGVGEVLAIAYTDSSWRDMVVWALLLVVLLVRPQGMFARSSSVMQRA